MKHRHAGVQQRRAASFVFASPATEARAHQMAREFELRLFERAQSDPQVVGEGIAIEQEAQRAVDALPTLSPWARVVGPVHTTKSVMARLGIPSRQAVNDRVRRRTLLGLKTADNHVVYPAFQFARRTVLAGLSDILGVLEDSADDWTIASWLVAPQPGLAGESVVERLRADRGASPAVLRAAAAAHARWSH